jgi:serine/threonine protein kinase
MSSPPSSAGGLIGQRLGKYELVALLALGGTAEIYLARIGGVAGFEKYVVVKCLHDHLADDSEFVRMFLDEARLGAQLTHSNIVQTLELGQQKSRYYMVMEYVAGMSMAVIARKAAEHMPGGRLPVDMILGLMAQACAGLHYAHNRADSSGKPLHIVHRDVSPQNLVVTFDGMLKVVDFGIAKAAVRETQTQSGTIKGKFAYMSPEQCQGQRVDRRTDVFALGVVVHELLTGKRLFKRDTAYDTYHAIMAGKVPPPSQDNHEIDPALDPIVLKALAYDSKDRYQSAEELGEALSSVLHRRGKSVGAGDVALFFDRYFATEIAEHGQRMRALISGRNTTTTMDEYWNDLDDSGTSDAEAKAGSGGVGSSSIDVHLDAVLPGEPSQASLVDSHLLEEVEMEDDDDDIGGGATRVELNPLEAVQKLHNDGAASQAADGADAGNKKTVGYPAMSRAGRSALDMPSPADVVNRRSSQSINAAAARSLSPFETSQRSSGKTLTPPVAVGGSALATGKQRDKFAPPMTLLDTHPGAQEEATGLTSPPDGDGDLDDEAATLIPGRPLDADVERVLEAARAAQASAGMAGAPGQNGAPYPGQGGQGPPEGGVWTPQPGQQGGPWGQQPGSWGGQPGQQPGSWGGQPGQQPGSWGGQPGQQPGSWGGQPGQQPGPWGGQPGQQPGQQPGPWGGQPGQQPGPWGQPGMPQGYPGQSPYPVMQNPAMGLYNQQMDYTGGMPRQGGKVPPWLMIAIIVGAGVALGAIILLALLL